MKECYGTHGVDHFEECREIREKYMEAANVRHCHCKTCLTLAVSFHGCLSWLGHEGQECLQAATISWIDASPYKGKPSDE